MSNDLTYSILRPDIGFRDTYNHPELAGNEPALPTSSHTGWVRPAKPTLREYLDGQLVTHLSSIHGRRCLTSGME